MFGPEAAVKHTLLESENPKYLGTDDGIINIGLMTKLYHIVAHNLNEARKARDVNKKSTKRKGTSLTPRRRQRTHQRPHIQSISAKIQRFLHSRTARKKSDRNKRQPRSHN